LENQVEYLNDHPQIERWKRIKTKEKAYYDREKEYLNDKAKKLRKSLKKKSQNKPKFNKYENMLLQHLEPPSSRSRRIIPKYHDFDIIKEDHEIDEFDTFMTVDLPNTTDINY
jgi:hypothetical protein